MIFVRMLFAIALITVGTVLTSRALDIDWGSVNYWIVFVAWAIIGNVVAAAFFPDKNRGLK